MRRTILVLLGFSLSIISLGYFGKQTESAGWKDRDSKITTIAESIPQTAVLKQVATLRVNPATTSGLRLTPTNNLFSNVAPVANDDFYTGSVNVYPPGVLLNDTDADGDHLFAHLYSHPLHGILSFNLNGGFSYTPNPGFTGIDSFTYRADDGTSMRSNEATVTISVRPIPTPTPTPIPTPTPGPASIQCWAANYSGKEDQISVGLMMTRTGDVSGGASVDFGTVDNAGLQNCNEVKGIASPRCDFIVTNGSVHFAAGETAKTIYVPIINDSYAEGDEAFTFRLSNATGATLGAPSSITITIHDNEQSDGVNPIDDIDFFIRQLYLDFLDREPEPKGLQDWHNVLANCPAGSKACDRIEVASAFFRSPEFQERGYFIYRLYPTIGKSVNNTEFIRDFAKVSGYLTDQQLEEGKKALVDEFMARSDFQNTYAWTANSPSAYVYQLLQYSGLPNHPNRQFWAAALTNGTMTRAEVLRALVDSSEMYQNRYTASFVVMSYFGYLRRSPDELYWHWIVTLNQSGGADYRTMVIGFLNSTEYRQRFGP